MMCILIPIVIGIVFHVKAPDDPTKLFLLGWITVALVSLFKCDVPSAIKREIVEIADFARRSDPLLAIARIFQHNILILILSALLGKGYYGFAVSYTALVGSSLSRGYPLNVVLGAHTLLELYAYALATTRRKPDLVKSVLYLLVAAAFEVTAIRF
ncbi:hypothetical protein [Ignicoccus hospitalis]|uniref:Uncharacterized protein n=1 Tax=Ignicoccus hospitalis (strain KIN4/I / DSM 18386 / JCM 14125) TaxID=453591 RepID=A8AAC9_IGNH4|nr:hypothetical protein [Ignicoccus hospitalis]ABU81881.1 hypothetical protein Igni_0699 [Ignicoccus hospitalis KIN4/I]HIH89961.1 hypothetical protein [Desulfurococcaceae archaeon]